MSHNSLQKKKIKKITNKQSSHSPAGEYLLSKTNLKFNGGKVLPS